MISPENNEVYLRLQAIHVQVHEPHTVIEVWEQAVFGGEGEDGGDATAEHVLDRGDCDIFIINSVWLVKHVMTVVWLGSVLEEGLGHLVRV